MDDLGKTCIFLKNATSRCGKKLGTSYSFKTLDAPDWKFCHPCYKRMHRLATEAFQNSMAMALAGSAEEEAFQNDLVLAESIEESRIHEEVVSIAALRIPEQKTVEDVESVLQSFQEQMRPVYPEFNYTKFLFRGRHLRFQFDGISERKMRSELRRIGEEALAENVVTCRFIDQGKETVSLTFLIKEKGKDLRSDSASGALTRIFRLLEAGKLSDIADGRLKSLYTRLKEQEQQAFKAISSFAETVVSQSSNGACGGGEGQFR